MALRVCRKPTRRDPGDTGKNPHKVSTWKLGKYNPREVLKHQLCESAQYSHFNCPYLETKIGSYFIGDRYDKGGTGEPLALFLEGA